MMSRGPKRNYNNRTISPKIRLSKFPYLPEKIEEILIYYKLNVSELARRSHIKQSGLSRCLNGHSLISEPSVHLLSRSLDDPIPMWWLTAGPEAGSLEEVLRKEKEKEQEQRQEQRAQPIEVVLDEFVTAYTEKRQQLDALVEGFAQKIKKMGGEERGEGVWEISVMSRK